MNEFNNSVDTAAVDEKVSSNSTTSSKKPIGVVTQTIGSGDDAHNSIVYLTIQWSFIVAAATTLIFCVYRIWRQVDISVDEVKSVWSIFIPLITLGLGYIFGKAK